MHARGVWLGRSGRRFIVLPNLEGSALAPVAHMRHAASGGRSAAVEPDESAHVVGDIGKADFNPRAGQPDRFDKESHQSLLMREHMFDRRADLDASINASSIAH
jgi:hypothetical protein